MLGQISGRTSLSTFQAPAYRFIGVARRATLWDGGVVRYGTVVSFVVIELWLAGAGQTARAERCPRGTKSIVHKVRLGECLSDVAADYGVTVPKILQANPGLKPDRVREGQKITICELEPEKLKPCGRGRRWFSHKVRRGETLIEIANRYGVAVQSIVRSNPSLSSRADPLRAGQSLQLCAAPGRALASKVCGFLTRLHSHEVVPGEYLTAIASRYGVRRKELLRLNPQLRSHPDRLRPGQRIRVCPDIAPRERRRIAYTVRSGDSLAAIARRYGLTVREVIGFQRGRLKNPKALSPGQRLVVWIDGEVLPGYQIDSDGGALARGVQLPPSRHYTIKNQTLSWGAPRTVQLVQSAIGRYRNRFRGGPLVHVGDLSKHDGGPLPPHVSHQTGQDVDIAYVLLGEAGRNKKFQRATKSNLDARRSWALIKAFLDTDHVQYIFVDYYIQRMLYERAKAAGVRDDELEELFQYPRGTARARGIIRHSKGHDDHFHVRLSR